MVRCITEEMHLGKTVSLVVNSPARCEEAVARDEQQWREARRRERAQAAAERARVKLPLARTLEKMGKTTGAINDYRGFDRGLM